jgi:ABC-type sugar transport system substrate-binding protein
MFSTHSKRAVGVAGIALILAATAGCTQGSSDGDVADAGTSDSSGPRYDRAAAAATAIVEELGGPLGLEAKTIGFLQLNAQAEVAARIETGAKDAVEAIGWKFVSCDSEGNPAKMASCGSSLLNQGVDAILSVAIEPAAINAQLEEAADKGVPWITVGGGVTPTPLFAAQLAPHETEMATLIDAYLIEQLGDGPKTLAASTFSAVLAGKARSDQLIEDLKGTEIELVDLHESDLANQVDDARRWATTILTAYPDVDAMLGTADYSLWITGDVIAAKFPGAAYPERPLNVGYLDDLVNLKAIRDGKADALATMRLDATSWIAVDQLAEYFARGTAVDDNAYFESATVYGLEFNDAVLITSENLPPEGEYVTPKEDFETFFALKWGQEFGQD